MNVTKTDGHFTSLKSYHNQGVRLAWPIFISDHLCNMQLMRGTETYLLHFNIDKNRQVYAGLGSMEIKKDNIESIPLSRGYLLPP